MIRIRAATLEDRGAIWRLHTEAIRRLCATHYRAEEIEAWALALSPERYTAVVTDPAREFVVAEEGSGIVGFGQFHPDGAEIEAIYVDPGRAREGIGATLLRRFEEHARRGGLESLRLTATLNAVAFYESQGFEATGQGEHAHPSGIALRCVFMRKALPAAR